tara:strand:- start:2049 stop:2492 length:444 start_codon:yes stop_codon:yes gene_type:complete
MRKLMLSLSISLFATALLAAENSELVLNSEHPCVRVKLSQEQISAIKEIVYKNSQLRAQDEANVKKAMLEVDHTLASSTSTKEQAEKAQNNLQAALASLTKTVAQLDLSINYDVLHADQREMGSLCSKSLYSFPPVVANAVASNNQP